MAAAGDDDLDYMSDAFILGSVQKDIRPGLIQSRSAKRNHEMTKKKVDTDQQNRVKNRPVQEIAEENLREGLQKPLDSDNKGFALLQKMGYKPGSGLGKSGEGSAVPISVEVKNNREGLGVKAALKEVRAAQLKKWKEAQKNVPSVNDFRARMIDVANERQDSIDLFKSQKICMTLDIKEESAVPAPLEPWFWPDNTQSSDEEGSDEDKEDKMETEEMPLSVKDKLEMLTVYLRKTYFYCIWCGVGYDDEKDLLKECPGPSRGDH